MLILCHSAIIKQCYGNISVIIFLCKNFPPGSAFVVVIDSINKTIYKSGTRKIECFARGDAIAFCFAAVFAELDDNNILCASMCRARFVSSVVFCTTQYSAQRQTRNEEQTER